MKHAKQSHAAVFALAATIGAGAFGIPVVIESQTTISANDETIGGVPFADADLVVRGCVLYLNRAVELKSLRLERWLGKPAVISRFGVPWDKLACRISVREDCTIEGGCSIEQNATGYFGATGNDKTGDGPGGGSSFVTPSPESPYVGGAGHGGDGGGFPTSIIPSPGIQGTAYGSVSKPTTLGSGGGAWGWPYYQGAGGRGGGAIHLIVGGQFSHSGRIEALGGSAAGDQYFGGGGGAGGSIWIEAAIIRGTGSISAKGGSGNDFGNGQSGGGGGGRIAIYCSDSTLLPTQIDVRGGHFFTLGPKGQIGTVYFGSGTIHVLQSPAEDIEIVEGTPLTMEVVAVSAAGSIQSYRWRRMDSLGEFQSLVDTATIIGTATSTLSMTPRCGDGGPYDVFIEDVNGFYPAPTFALRVLSKADFDRDGLVNDEDFQSFAVAYNLLICDDPEMPVGCPADLNNDGLTDDADFVMFVAAYDALLCP